jgi:hypothetical protein
MNDFAAFILTNGRPDNVKTYNSLRKRGYSGRIVIVVDDLDKTREQYVAKYGNEVEIFDKKAIAKTFDSGDNFQDMRAIIYARNASFEIAKKLKIKYFIQLDDDYTAFKFRFNKELEYWPRSMRNLDRVFSSMVKFFEASGVDSIAMSQGGDFIGGEENQNAKIITLKRKCMNSFLCSTNRPFKFIGRINEDVNAYTRLASTGLLVFTTNQISLEQTQTQTSAGGMTELYLDSGTYVKSFYSVMYQPSSVKIKIIRDRKDARLHHSVAWNKTVPKILREPLIKQK